jgi:hypothetical protein
MRRQSRGPFFVFAVTLFAVSTPTKSFAAAQPLTHTVTVTSTGFLIRIQSPTENISYQWVAPSTGSLYSIGTVLITDSINGASPQGQISLNSGMDWIGPSESLQSVAYQTAGAPSATLTYLGPNGTTHLTISPLVDGSFAGLRFSADRATLQDIYIGQLPSSLSAEAISVPYYSQAAHYIGSLALFENSYFDPFDSHASTISTTSGQKTFYALNEHGTTTNVLKDIWKVSVSDNIMNVLPYPEHPASPYMSQLAGRLVMDIKGGTFDTIASQVANLGNYGRISATTMGIPPNIPPTPRLAAKPACVR